MARQPVPPTTPLAGERTVFRDYERGGPIVIDADDLPPEKVRQGGTDTGKPPPPGTPPAPDQTNAGLQAQIAALVQRLAAVEDGVRYLGRVPFETNGRPPMPLWTLATSLQARIATLETKLAAAEGRIGTLEKDVAALKTHHHTYSAGVTYWNKSIHGHPGFGVPQKYVSYITQSLSYSDSWTTSAPQNY